MLGKQTFDGSDLPPLVDPHGAEFKEWYGHGVARHKEVFGNDEHSHRVHELLKPEELDALIDSAPVMHQHVLAEIATLMREYARNGNKVQGEKLWRHQEALLAEFAQTLVTKRVGANADSVLMEEAAGTGKTRVMGIVVQAVSRLMVRDLFQKNLLLLVRRKGMVMQQAVQRDHRMVAALSLLDGEKIPGTRSYKHLENMFAHHPRALLRPDTWNELWTQAYLGPDDARKRLEQAMRDDRVYEEFRALPDGKTLLDDAAALLAGHAVPVNAPFGNERELLRLTPPRSAKSVERGDLLFGIHKSIMDTRGAVFVQSNIDWDHVNDDELPTETTRIGLLSLGSIAQERTRNKIGEYLSNVRMTILDEAGRTPSSELQSMVTDRGGRKPFVFAATAWDPKERLHYDARLSTLSTAKAVEDGVLKPQRLHVFPEDPAEMLAPGSYEAAEQLVREYGKTLAFPKKQGVPQPTDGHHLIMVPSTLVPYVAMRLREEYGGAGTQFVSYDDNSGERESLVIQAALNADGDQICVVGSSAVIDSYDWTKLRSAWLAVPENDTTLEVTKRFFGRQAHSRQQNGYFVQQRFASPDSVNRTAWRAYPDGLPTLEDSSLALVPGQHFLGVKAIDAEKPLAAKYSSSAETHRVFSPAERKTMVAPDASYPPGVILQREMGIPAIVRFPAAIAPFDFNRAYLESFAALNELEDDDVDELEESLKGKKKQPDILDALRSATIAIRLRRLPREATRRPPGSGKKKKSTV